ncbi:hypothetical protein LZ31DRAFT_386911 [Colletotrichum somersetense]|nr:hypothetical protein LZ31DRAFT_386911 [Colletotrichum somersetense]
MYCLRVVCYFLCSFLLLVVYERKVSSGRSSHLLSGQSSWSFPYRTLSSFSMQPNGLPSVPKKVNMSSGSSGDRCSFPEEHVWQGVGF